MHSEQYLTDYHKKLDANTPPATPDAGVLPAAWEVVLREFGSPPQPWNESQYVRFSLVRRLCEELVRMRTQPPLAWALKDTGTGEYVGIEFDHGDAVCECDANTQVPLVLEPLYLHPTPPRSATVDAVRRLERCMAFQCGADFVRANPNATEKNVEDAARSYSRDAASPEPGAVEDGREAVKQLLEFGQAILDLLPDDKRGCSPMEAVEYLREALPATPRATQAEPGAVEAHARYNRAALSYIVTRYTGENGEPRDDMPDWAHAMSDLLLFGQTDVDVSAAPRADATAGGVTDTERLDWLQSKARRESRDGGWWGVWWLPSLDGWSHTPYAKASGTAHDYADIRAAIDAALRAAQPTSGGEG